LNANILAATRGDQKFWFLFRCEGKILMTLFGDHIFPYGDCKNNFSRQLAPAEKS